MFPLSTPLPATDMTCLLWLALALAGPYDDGVKALREGRFDEARAFLQQAIDAEDRPVDAWWELGWAHWTLEDYGHAKEAWEKVEELDPTHEELQQWLSAARTRVALAEAGREPVTVGTEASEGDRLTVAAVGDTMMGSDLRRGPSGLPPDDGQSIFDPVLAHLERADVAFANLEGPLADGLPSRKCRPDSTACYAFRTPTRFTAALTHAGIDLAQLANNHAMDLGSAGQEATMKALDGVGIAHSGRYGDVGSIERNGLKIALVAAHSGSCCLNVNKLDEVGAAIRQADKDHDLVFFVFHGGAEGERARHVPGKTEIAWGERRGDVKALGRAAVDAGADLVIGSGPHVLRAMEVYKGRLIAYSMGNFVGYKQFGAGEYTGTSALLEVELAPNGVVTAAKIVPLKLDENSAPQIDPAKKAFGQISELSKADFPDSGVSVAEDGSLGW